jgi:hypothetical protein
MCLFAPAAPRRCASSSSRTSAMVIIPVVHIVRRLNWDKVREVEKGIAEDVSVTAPTPNRSVHARRPILLGAELVRDNVRGKIPSEVDVNKLSASRRAIINIWRSLIDVTRYSLACCDARTAGKKTWLLCMQFCLESLTKAREWVYLSYRHKIRGIRSESEQQMQVVG